MTARPTARWRWRRRSRRAIRGIVRAIHQENKGHGGAVNTGIAAASGMYVKVVDADDWVGPESLEQVMAVLRGEVGKDEPPGHARHQLCV